MIDPSPDEFDGAAVEAELRRFDPLPPAASVRTRIAAALDTAPAVSKADRFLLTYMSLGAAAAVLIATLLSLDFFTRDSSPPPAAPALAARAQQTREFLNQLAAGEDPFNGRP